MCEAGAGKRLIVGGEAAPHIRKDFVQFRRLTRDAGLTSGGSSSREVA